ncbi:MAG TPA: hypothetical protein VN151_06810, partial [Terracidiphilus sp.]|nr:hypothetical protein [Terracidiphilus sp.]
KPRWFPALASKELLVGMLFASGCTLPTLLRADTSTRIDVLIAAAYLAVLAWLNCYAIDRWEASPDASIARSAGVLAVVGGLLALALRASHPAAAALVTAAAASAALLVLLDAARTRMTALTLRAAADLVLLTPVVLLR